MSEASKVPGFNVWRSSATQVDIAFWQQSLNRPPLGTEVMRALRDFVNVPLTETTLDSIRYYDNFSYEWVYERSPA